jgi:hypothetical protein
MIGSRDELLRARSERWGARSDGQQCRRERHRNAPGRHETRDLDDAERRPGEGKHGHRGCTELACEAMILVVHRTGMMVVVGVGARLVRRMGKDSPAGFFRGTGLARPCLMLVILVDLVECRRHDPGEVEQQEQRCSVSHPGRPLGSKISTTHATKPTADPRPTPRPQEAGCPALELRRRSAVPISRMQRSRKRWIPGRIPASPRGIDFS